MTSTDTRASRSDRLSPRNWPLAWKLVAVGLVPALLAIVLGVLRVAEQARTASDLGTANRMVDVREQVAAAATALRVERNNATLFVAERRLGDRGPLQDAIGRTDGAVEQLRTGLAQAGELDPVTRLALDEAQEEFTQLSGLRGDVTGSATLEPSRVTERYTSIIARVDELASALLRQVRAPDTADLADALTAATAASEALARQHTVLGAALRVGRITETDRAAVYATDNALGTAYNSYFEALPPGQPPVNFATSRERAQLDADKASILATPSPGPISVTVPQWDQNVQAVASQIDAASSQTRTALSAAGDAAESRASNLAGINSVILMLGMLLAATIVVLVVRALTRSLRVLRTSALDVAERRLPQAVENMRSGGVPDVAVEPVPLPNRDEVGQVARAFDAVHGQALRLAADQAALQSNVSSMFVNLSRRSQALVERQLQLIEQLESNEQDPDQLSNLFQLDHLATRMRRNSENLLVLAGTDVAKRNVAPVPLVDVLRAAVSEIEQYQRIVVQAPPQATVVGRATSDVVHLLAELLDNATNFSPPDSQVVMSSMRTADGSILVEIADRGVGMLDHELADANMRLSTASAVDVSASRRMGLVVVGRLAARHGIAVHLGGAPTGGPGGGLTASVTLPAHLVASGADDGGRPRANGSSGHVDGPAAVSANGLPERMSRPEQPAARALPTTQFDPQLDPQPASSAPSSPNGLPTRTPGSALRRVPTAGQVPSGTEVARPADRHRGTGEVAEPFAAGPGSGREAAAEWSGAGQAEPARTQAGQADVARSDAERVDARSAGEREDAEAVDDDAVPTRALPVVTPHGDTAEGGVEQGAAERPRDHRGTDRATVWTADGRAGDEQSGTQPAGAEQAATQPSGHLAGLQRARMEAAARRAAAAEAAAADGDSRPANADTPPARSGSTRGDIARALGARAEVEREGGAHPAAERETAELETTEHRSAQPDATGPDTTGPDTTGPEFAEQQAAEQDAAVPGTDRPAPAEQAPERADPGQIVQHTGPEQPAAAGVREPEVDGADQGAPLPRRRPRPRPAAGPNGTQREHLVPPTPFEVHPDAGTALDATGPNGLVPNSRADTPADTNGVDHGGADQAAAAWGGIAPPTRPLPVPPAAPDEGGADALFAPSVPAITEPDGLPRSRRPLTELRRGTPEDLTETTPIFEEIASAWFAAHRPVPVDWELGRRPGAEAEPQQAEAPVAAAPFGDARPQAVEQPQPTPATSERPAEPRAEHPVDTPVDDDAAARFATAADEGWRAASGAAADRPDELTSAGLPKRRPRARLVPGSAGSAVLAAPASPTRSAESIRGRLASYQQGVRQGRETRLRRDPGSAGPQPASNGENGAASPGGDHDEDNR